MVRCFTRLVQRMALMSLKLFETWQGENYVFIFKKGAIIFWKRGTLLSRISGRNKFKPSVYLKYCLICNKINSLEFDNCLKNIK